MEGTNGKEEIRRSVKGEMQPLGEAEDGNMEQIVIQNDEDPDRLENHDQGATSHGQVSAEDASASASGAPTRRCRRIDCACGGKPAAAEPAPSYVYALGRIEARFPTAGIEKEFAQAVGRIDTSGQTDQEALRRALSRPENRYLARKMCWVCSIQGIDTYLLAPRDSSELDLLIDSIRSEPSPLDLDIVIGQRGPLAPPSMCNGLTVPVVFIDQVYSCDSRTLIDSIPRPEGTKAKDFQAVAEEVFYRIMQITDNAGATDEHRALNYLAVRYPDIYTATAEAHVHERSLSRVDVRDSRLRGTRTIKDVVLQYTDRKTDVKESFFVRVDVTEAFPFLVSKLAPFIDR